MAPTTPGVISDAVVYDFTRGWCWALSAAIEDRYGIEPVVIRVRGAVVHYGNRLPDGSILDVEGVASPGDWMVRWSMQVRAEPDEAAIEPASLSGSDRNGYPYSRAVLFAEAVMNLAGPPMLRT